MITSLSLCLLFGGGPLNLFGPKNKPGDPPPTPVVIQDLFLRQYDRNRDGRLSLDEMPTNLISKFAKTDGNQDGFLDSREIIFSHTSIGMQARKLEGLRLKGNQLVDRTAGQGGAALVAVAATLRQMDLDHDGYVDTPELAAAFRNPQLVLQPVIEALGITPSGQTPPPMAPTEPPMPPTPPAGAPPTVVPPAPLPMGTLPPPTITIGPANDPVPPPPTANPAPTIESQPRAAVQAPAVSPPITSTPTNKATKGKKDDWPTVDEIFAALDKNHNNMIERAEAADKLVENFDRIDKDRNNALDRDEMDKALKLARLFGIKPNFTAK